MKTSPICHCNQYWYRQPGGASTGHVSEHGRSLDITFSRSWLQSIMSQSVKKYRHGHTAVSLFGTLFSG